MKNQHELFVVEDCEDGEWISSLDGADYSVYHTFAEAEYALAAEADSREPSSHFEIIRFARVPAEPAVPTKPSISLDKLGSVKQGLDVTEWYCAACSQLNSIVALRCETCGAEGPPRVAAPPYLPVQDGEIDQTLREIVSTWVRNNGGFGPDMLDRVAIPAFNLGKNSVTGPAPAVQDERAEFEDAYWRRFPNGYNRYEIFMQAPNSNPFTYWRAGTQASYEIWQAARASRSASADGKGK